ncbi:uncharacterized protein [Ptychodera flava]|uniref:uncharacterized protein n=1 Tax=Ptychodera flava TaxID=63121 RepID=UPI00396A5E02
MLEIADLRSRVEKIEQKFDAAANSESDEQNFDINRLVIVVNLVAEEEEDLPVKVTHMVHNVLNLPDAQVLKCRRMLSRNDKPGVVKVEFETRNQKYKGVCIMYKDRRVAQNQRAGCPLQLRGDPGNENGTVAAMQVFLLQSAFDQYEWESSFLYGKSTSNQRIECFWSQLLKSWTEWWRQYFIAMEREGLFTLRHNLHKCLVRYCYLGVIQAELDEVINQWNDHPLRQQRQLEVPCGIPNILYYSPELTGGTDMLQPFGEDTSNLHQYTSFPSYIGDDSLEELLDDIMTNEGLLPPRTSREAKQLYQTLKEICENTL